MKLKDYVDELQITLTRCSRNCGISYQIFWNFYHERRMPNLFQAKKIVEWSKGIVGYEDLMLEKFAERKPRNGK